MSSEDGPRGHLFIVSAPSGAGKTTLIRAMMESERPKVEGLVFSVSHTTRAPRSGESDGREYHFVSDGAFAEMVEGGRFLEWARVHGHCYGTSLDEVLPHLEAGRDVVVDIDVQGAHQILESASSEIPRRRVHGIFIMPPGFDELRRRLEARNLDAPEVIRRRLREAGSEVERCQEYDYVIVNRDVERASCVLASIILDKQHRRERMRERIASVLDDFRRGHDVP